MRCYKEWTLSRRGLQREREELHRPSLGIRESRVNGEAQGKGWGEARRCGAATGIEQALVGWSLENRAASGLPGRTRALGGVQLEMEHGKFQMDGRWRLRWKKLSWGFRRDSRGSPVIPGSERGVTLEGLWESPAGRLGEEGDQEDSSEKPDGAALGCWL